MIRLTASLIGGLLAAAAIVVIGLRIDDALHSPNPRPRTTVLVAPPRTSLTARQRRRIARRAATRSPDSGPSRVSTTRPSTSNPGPSTTGPRKRAQSRRRRKTTRSPSRAPSAPQGGSQAPQATSTPAAPSRPPVDVTVPAPARVCVRGVGGVNCP